MSTIDKAKAQWEWRWMAMSVFGATMLVAGCGGGDSRDIAERAQLRMQAIVYRVSGNIILPGSPPPCEEVISFFVVRAGPQGFPAGFQVDRIVLTRDGSTWWEQAPASAETGLRTKWLGEDDWVTSPGSTDGSAPPGTHSEMVMQGVARGCLTSPIGDDEVLGIELKLRAGSEQGSIKSLAVMQVAS